MGLPFPPLEDPAFAGSYTQIPLNANTPLTPYKDLGAGNAYGRALIYPDDIIPTNGLVTLFGNSPPNLLRDSGQPGAADVFVVNQSGGGGGVTPTTPTPSGTYISGFIDAGAGQTNLFTTGSGLHHLWIASYAIVFTGDNGHGYPQPWSLHLTGTWSGITIAQGAFTSATTDLYAHDTVVYPTGIGLTEGSDTATAYFSCPMTAKVTLEVFIA